MTAANRTTAAAQSGGIDFTWIVSFVLIVLAVGFIWFLWYRRKVHLHQNAERFLQSVFLEVQAPRDVLEKDAAREPQKEEKEIISVAEQLFTSLSQTESKGFIGAHLRNDEHISFEIVSIQKKISFYINCPRHMQSLVEKQIHAQYPKAHIEEVPFLNFFRPNSVVAAAEFALQKKYYYPIRTYKNLETDPLNAITNSL